MVIGKRVKRIRTIINSAGNGRITHLTCIRRIRKIGGTDREFVMAIKYDLYLMRKEFYRRMIMARRGLLFTLIYFALSLYIQIIGIIFNHTTLSYLGMCFVWLYFSGQLLGMYYPWKAARKRAKKIRDHKLPDLFELIRKKRMWYNPPQCVPVRNYDKYVFNITPSLKRKVMSGIQYEFKFKNKYGASVVKSAATYGSSKGLWELAVLGPGGGLIYTTKITDDVMGYRTHKEIRKTLKKIRRLRKHNTKEGAV